MFKNSTKVYLALFFLSLPFLSSAQEPLRANARDIYFKTKRLANLGNVLYVAAHPDDENTHLLTYFIHHEGVNTTYYSLTRGEGGQNILGKELGKPLGIIRTLEMYEARKIDGAAQRFGTAPDFGFSKTPLETFSFWNKNKILEETINLIQELKPDLIICRFPTTGEGGHGHHTASAIIAKEAYELIEKRIKEGQNLWLPKRVLFNAFAFRSFSTLKEDQFKLPLNQYNPLLGKSYAQIAGESRSVHHSQGAGTPQIYGETKEHFELMVGKDFETSLWEGIDFSWNRIQAKYIEKDIKNILKNFNFKHPSSHWNAFVKIKNKIEKLENSTWKNQKLQEVDNILLDILGLRIELATEKQAYTSEELNEIKLKAIQGTELNVEIIEVLWNGGNILNENIVIENETQIQKYIKNIDFSSLPISEMHWLQKDGKKQSFPIELEIKILIENEISITKSYPLTYYYLDPVWGDKYQFTYIHPKGQIAVRSNFLLKEKDNTIVFPLELQINEKAKNVELALYKDEKLIIKEAIEWKNQNQGIPVYYEWNVEMKKALNFEDGLYQVQLKWKSSNDRVNEANGKQELIKYDHIPQVPFYIPSTIKILNNDFTINTEHVAYIHGVGDKVGEVLEQLGINVTYLKADNIKSVKDIEKYDAIIIGIRAYNRIEALNNIHEILKSYVYQGGNLIVQYNTNHELIREDIGILPLELSRDRVTEEDAHVTPLLPEHPILNTPHKITNEDFEGWIQERGLYYPNSWDAKYQAILSMHDTDETPTHGALLTLNYGKGTYIYTGLSFFRQLPYGNKGAMRLFLNLLEYK